MNQKEKSNRSRLQILSAAADEFGENTFDKASLTQMCRRAGISKGKLYHHFQSKEEIYLAALQYCCDLISESQEQATQQFGADLKDNLLFLIDARSETSLKQPGIPMLIWGAMHHPPEELRKHTEKIISHYQEKTNQRLYRAIAASSYHKQLDYSLCVEAVSMVFNHGAYHAIRNWNLADQEKNRQLLTENRIYIGKFIDMILYGVLRNS